MRPVGGEQRELTAVVKAPESAEVPLVERQDRAHPVAGGEDDRRCIGQTRPKVCVPADDARRVGHVVAGHRLEAVGAARDLGQQRELGVLTPLPASR
ncbi:MAG: hypothetical protein M3N52_00830 [Actinomycetota bacterium]|nr:hypothetical protein [Actinomycetota bacterium]